MLEINFSNILVALILLFVCMFWKEIKYTYLLIVGKMTNIKGTDFTLISPKNNKGIEYFIRIKDIFDEEYKLIKTDEDFYDEIYCKKSTKKEILVSIFCKIHRDGLLEAVRIKITKINPKI